MHWRLRHPRGCRVAAHLTHQPPNSLRLAALASYWQDETVRMANMLFSHFYSGSLFCFNSDTWFYCVAETRLCCRWPEYPQGLYHRG